jgi:WD40 repeat protein
MQPFGLAFGPDGNLYVSGLSDTAEVLQYDAATGAFLGTFVPRPTGDLEYNARGLTFGPDGNLYVVGVGADGGQVDSYNGTTGDFIDTFVPGFSGGLDVPYFAAFTPAPVPEPSGAALAFAVVAGAAMLWLRRSQVTRRSIRASVRELGRPSGL